MFVKKEFLQLTIYKVKEIIKEVKTYKMNEKVFQTNSI